MLRYKKDLKKFEVNFMRYLGTFFWTILLMEMLTYVAGSMLGVSFQFETGIILGVISTVLIIIISSILPEPSGGKEVVH
jgi:hypothetical protein